MNFLNPWQAHFGTVKLLNSAVMVSGNENRIGSHVVTLFEIDGMAVEYTGQPLPLRDGETAVAVGWPPHNGIFKACFVALPARGSLFQPYSLFGHCCVGLVGLILTGFLLVHGAFAWALLTGLIASAAIFQGFAWREGRALAMRHMARFRTRHSGSDQR
jgi:hypothetical protein